MHLKQKQKTSNIPFKNLTYLLKQTNTSPCKPSNGRSREQHNEFTIISGNLTIEQIYRSNNANKRKAV